MYSPFVFSFLTANTKITKLSQGDIWLYSLVGMLVVLISLAIFAIIIMLTSKIVEKLEKKPAPVSAEPVPGPAVRPSAAPAAGYTDPKTLEGEMILRDTDDQTAALLMAIVADQSKIPLNELRFKSIKCLNPQK